MLQIDMEGAAVTRLQDFIKESKAKPKAVTSFHHNSYVGDPDKGVLKPLLAQLVTERRLNQVALGLNFTDFEPPPFDVIASRCLRGYVPDYAITDNPTKVLAYVACYRHIMLTTEFDDDVMALLNEIVKLENGILYVKGLYQIDDDLSEYPPAQKKTVQRIKDMYAACFPMKWAYAHRQIGHWEVHHNCEFGTHKPRGTYRIKAREFETSVTTEVMDKAVSSSRMRQQFCVENIHHLYAIRHAYHNNLLWPQLTRRSVSMQSRHTRVARARSVFPKRTKALIVPFDVDCLSHRALLAPQFNGNGSLYARLDPEGQYAAMSNVANRRPGSINMRHPDVHIAYRAWTETLNDKPIDDIKNYSNAAYSRKIVRHASHKINLNYAAMRKLFVERISTKEMLEAISAAADDRIPKKYIGTGHSVFDVKNEATPKTLMSSLAGTTCHAHTIYTFGVLKA